MDLIRLGSPVTLSRPQTLKLLTGPNLDSLIYRHNHAREIFPKIPDHSYLIE